MLLPPLQNAEASVQDSRTGAKLLNEDAYRYSCSKGKLDRSVSIWYL